MMFMALFGNSKNRLYYALGFFLTTVIIASLIVRNYLPDFIRQESNDLFKEEIESRYLQEINWIKNSLKEIEEQREKAKDNSEEVAKLTTLSTYFEQVLAFDNRKTPAREIQANCPSCSHSFSISV